MRATVTVPAHIAAFDPPTVLPLLTLARRARELEAALRYGFNLYGYDEPDGPWPIERRREFDRMARAALSALHPIAGGRDERG